MLLPVLALLAAAGVAVIASVRDPIGWGYLLSTDVDGVAHARLAEPALALPPLYFLSAALVGVAVVAALPVGQPALARAALGIAGTVFVLVTLWDMRQRRGTVAVYIMLRRAELAFEPKGGVIEAPKLMFLVMNQPTPLVWLFTALALVGTALLAFPRESWFATLPVGAIGLVLVWFWLRNRHSPWERLARRLRWASYREGRHLREFLEAALDIDPEVVLIRQVADDMVVRLVSGEHRDGS